MNRQIALAAAAALALSALSSAALAQRSGTTDEGSVPGGSGSGGSTVNGAGSDIPFNNKVTPQSATLDLGVDVSNVPATREGTRQFLATLPPDGQQIMLDTCARYIAEPNAAQSAYTITFCKALLSG